MSDADHQDCWICGTPSTTGEHIIKKTDLKLEFGRVTQQEPLYFHRGDDKSKRFGSFDAKVLKSPLCAECNNSSTQPHDRAWEKLSTFLRTRKLEQRTITRVSDIFPDSPTQQMLNVHLYFVKLFGCRIVEPGGPPIDSRAFSNAILNGTAHPHLYLRLGCIVPFPEGKEIAGFSQVYAIRHADGSSLFCWLYGVGRMGVQVLHATNVASLPQEVWHPRLCTDSLVVAEFPGTEVERPSAP
jgi:hypothetical protein